MNKAAGRTAAVTGFGRSFVLAMQDGFLQTAGQTSVGFLSAQTSPEDPEKRDKVDSSGAQKLLSPS